MYYSKLKIFFFSLALFIFTGCANQTNLKTPSKNDSKVSKTAYKEKKVSEQGNEVKMKLRALERDLILDVERSPVKVMTSLVFPYVNRDKAIGLHVVDMVINYGEWNAEKKGTSKIKYLGGINE